MLVASNLFRNSNLLTKYIYINAAEMQSLRATENMAKFLLVFN
jgi:hypothetical protein